MLMISAYDHNRSQAGKCSARLEKVFGLSLSTRVPLSLPELFDSTDLGCVMLA